jgi:hypothetical protein
MKNPRSNKFYACLPVGMASIITALMFSGSANAQIVYTDIDPDISRTRTSVSGSVSVLTTEETMDVNNDGTPDLKFTLTSRRNRGRSWGPNPVPGPGGTPPVNPSYTSSINGNVSVTPLNGGAILSGSSAYPKKMNLNESVKANATWSTTANQILVSKSSNTTSPLGNWNTATDGFLGLRFIAGGKTHYCWIQLNVAAFSSGANAATLILKDFAYNSRRRSPILAGQKIILGPPPTTNITTAATPTAVTSMDEDLSSISTMSLYPNPATDKFTVDLGNTTQKVDLTIFDLKGKIVYSATETDAQRLQVNTSSFEKGIYVVQIRAGEFAGTQRLIITK